MVTFSELAAVGAARLLVRAPLGYVLACESAGRVDQVDLPGGRAACTDMLLATAATAQQWRHLHVDLNGSTLAIGSYAFGFRCTVPQATPIGDGANTTWSLQAFDDTGSVVDGVFRIRAAPVVAANIGSTAAFSWSRSEPNQVSLVTFGLTFNEGFPGVGSLLFICPQGFVQDNQQPQDFRILSSGFPSAGTDLQQLKFVRLFVAANATIPAAFHRFQFRVIVPFVLPQQNLWYVSLCSDRSCISDQDATVLLSFPIQGFNLRERSVVDLAAVAGAVRSRGPLGKPWAAAGLALLHGLLLR